MGGRKAGEATMINSVLVAVEDTAASMRAAEVAAELAHRLGGRLRVVTVLQDGVLTDALRSASREPAVAERPERTVAAVLAAPAATWWTGGAVVVSPRSRWRDAG